MPPVQSLPIISVNIWHILISLVNLVILFLLVKKFLYKPVRKMVAERKEHIAEQYRAAEEAQRSAEESKQEYSKKLADADSECNTLIKEAEKSSQRLSDEIISDAKDKAESMLRNADTEIELEQKKAMQKLKHDAADLSVDLAEKLLARKMTDSDQDELIDSFIDELGDSDDDGQ